MNRREYPLILCVDDDPRILNFLTAKLRASSYNVLTASCKKAAMEIVVSKEPDLIILNILMPKKEGRDMLEELRTFSVIPVIILSYGSEVSQADVVRVLNMGADDFVPKPFNPDELVARIEAILRRTSLRKKE